jgi:hypothetical protein
VRRIQRVGNLHGQLQQGFELQWLASDEMPECLALQQLHGDERLVLMFADFVDRADVRVVERRGSLGFALKTLQCLRITH